MSGELVSTLRQQMRWRGDRTNDGLRADVDGWWRDARTLAQLGPALAADSDQWLRRRTPPDYRDRQLVLGVRRRLLGGGQQVLFVDDWIDTGAQATAVRDLVAQAGASWAGAVVIVDALTDSRLRRDLLLRSLLLERTL